MIDRTCVAALIPAYREEARIADVSRRVLQELDHVLVIDDGSPDATSAEAAASGAMVETLERNQGKGGAIKAGFRILLETSCEYVLLLDGDGQHLPEEIPAFLAEANRSGAQMILGNRMTDLRTMPRIRKWTNLSMSWMVSKVCKQPIPDTQCGFRMLHRSVIPHLFCETSGFDYESEMLFLAARQGFQIASVPVSTVYGDERSKIRPVRDTIRFLKLLSRYR